MSHLDERDHDDDDRGAFQDLEALFIEARRANREALECHPDVDAWDLAREAAARFGRAAALATMPEAWRANDVRDDSEGMQGRAGRVERAFLTYRDLGQLTPPG
jgi:hypothetical protein